jgi:hypothetical protein
MSEIAEWTAQQTLKLPPEIASRFRPTDRFIVWAEGDALYLERITPTPVTQIVEQAPEGEPLTLDEVNEIVHQVRRQSNAG